VLVEDVEAAAGASGGGGLGLWWRQGSGLGRR
jgi:hypothetical protein